MRRGGRVSAAFAGSDKHRESLETHLRLNYVEALRATTTEIPTDRKCRRARCGLRDRRK
jgi:hypothetical protein